MSGVTYSMRHTAAEITRDIIVSLSDKLVTEAYSSGSNVADHVSKSFVTIQETVLEQLTKRE